MCFAVFIMIAHISSLFEAVIDLACQVLFEAERWDFLVDQFKQEFYRLYGMTLEPLLNIYLQAGLSALKTPYPALIIFYCVCLGQSMNPEEIS